MKRDYNADIRENDFVYLIRQAQELLNIASQRKSSSPIIYACLDSRIALEILDLNIILTSVGHEERLIIIEDSKPKNGIDKSGRKVGVLKEKYQLFFQAVCETVGLEGKSFDFKKSKDLQFGLSSYIHSYYMSNDELNYYSPTMQKAISIINETKSFINSSIICSDNKATIMGMELSSLPEQDKQILDEWKNSTKMSYTELKEKLMINHSK